MVLGTLPALPPHINTAPRCFSSTRQAAAAVVQVLPQGADELLDASVPSSQHVPRGSRASHHLPGKVRGFATPQGWEAEEELENDDPNVGAAGSAVVVFC